jgi:predicted PurR-regulated permease PerM
MNKNIKQVVVIVVTLLIAYLVFKLLKAAIYAVIIGFVLYISYHFVNKALTGKKRDEID